MSNITKSALTLFAIDSAAILASIGLGSFVTYSIMSKPSNHAAPTSDQNTPTYYMGTFTPPPADIPRAKPDLVVIPADSKEHAAWMVSLKLEAMQEAPRGNFYNQTIIMLQRDPVRGSMVPVDFTTYQQSLARARAMLRDGQSLSK